MQSYSKSCHISRYNVKISVSKLVPLGFLFVPLLGLKSQKNAEFQQ